MTGISLLLFAVFLALYLISGMGAFLSLCITFGVFSYHFVMRLAVGSAVNGMLHNHIDHTKWWFRSRPFEKRLYRALRVRKWRKHVPTYAPEVFSLEHHSLEEIIGATCQAEVVHEIIILLSPAPILLAIPFGVPGVFVATSVLAALLDAVFVILQRYNRPMLVKVSERIEKSKDRINAKET